MSPEMAGKQYEIKVRSLVGETEEDHRWAYRAIDIANDFLCRMNPSKASHPSGYFIENSTITALASFIRRADAQKFVKALLAGLNPVVKFTRDQDSTNRDPYNIEWVSRETGPASTDDQT